eukprot:GHVR01070465.1.p1 GENE.GHVR01070465.1~~GHVR01070465.1.p1  ORF type:complete len:110 (-),score=7.22 GHVR01070465.1:30-359(-)
MYKARARLLPSLALLVKSRERCQHVRLSNDTYSTPVRSVARKHVARKTPILHLSKLRASGRPAKDPTEIHLQLCFCSAEWGKIRRWSHVIDSQCQLQTCSVMLTQYMLP